MSEEIFVPEKALVDSKSTNYKLTIPSLNKTVVLKRDVDFGKFGQANKPSLLKAGAEKVLMAYGVESKFVLEQAVEDFGNIAENKPPMFFYRFRCELYWHGQHITDGYGSANSNEAACGRASKFDVANQRLKIAKKRAEVDAALMLAQISDMFYADIEDSALDTEKPKDKAFDVMRPDEPIGARQLKRLFTLCSQNGIDAEQAKALIKSCGYESAKDIKQKDYDTICNRVVAVEATAKEV